MRRRGLDRVLLANSLHERMISAGTLSGPLFCAEVGARKPPTKDILREPFYKLVNRRILAFEPDLDEAARLRKLIRHSDGIEVVAAALGDRDGNAQLYVTRNPSCSSLYKPNDDLLDRFPSLEVARHSHNVTVDLAKLDTVCAARKWPRVDFIKMDVQGAELDILTGADSTLTDVTAIVTEVSFQPIYMQQPLFGDIAAALGRRGFEFYEFVHLGGRSRTKTRPDQTQVLWGDALFLRSPEHCSVEQAARVAIFATLYGAFDFAESSNYRVDDKVAAWFTKVITPPRANFLKLVYRFAKRGYRSLARRVRERMGRNYE